jgi:hypothetical protein
VGRVQVAFEKDESGWRGRMDSFAVHASVLRSQTDVGRDQSQLDVVAMELGTGLRVENPEPQLDLADAEVVEESLGELLDVGG